MQPPARLGLTGLIWVMFFTVSGGAYGLEPLVGAVGPALSVLLLVLVPLLWALPIALMVAELVSRMPEEGGYYVWVRQGLGDFWGVQEGWWSLCYAMVDMAIYPVLFANYVAYFLPQPDHAAGAILTLSAPLATWCIALLVIGAALVVNMIGIRACGSSATLSGAVVLAPFLLMVLFWMLSPAGSAHSAVTSNLTGSMNTGLLALSLSIALWNYCGWDNISTFAAEVQAPRRTYPRAILITLPLVGVSYLLPVLAGIAYTTDPLVWHESQGWPVIARAVGGQWLGAVVALAALFSSYSLFNSQLLYASRLGCVLARDGWLPKAFARTSGTSGVPVLMLVSLCIISACFALLPFGKLVVMDILLYSAALALQFAALIRLRAKAPLSSGSFRIPGGYISLALITFAPMALAALVAVIALAGTEADPRQALLALAVGASGALIYVRGMKHRRKM